MTSSVLPEGRETDREQLHGVRKEGDERKNIAFPLSQGELAAVIAVFFGFGVALLSIYLTMPVVDYQVLKLPHNVAELRSLTEYLSVYAKNYPLQVVLGYCVTYIFMQTFMIPGTIFFSLLAGALFGVPLGLALVIFAATAGASSCFFLSKMVAKRKKKLLNYMLFLRITPTLPNTFINVASPIVDVPYGIFFLATSVGLIPAAFVTVRAGLALNDLNSVRDLYDAKTLAALFLIGLVSIVPTWADKVRTRQRRVPHLHTS